jgi:hypothetical protein
MTRLAMDALDLYLIEASTAIHILVLTLKTIKYRFKTIGFSGNSDSSSNMQPARLPSEIWSDCAAACCADQAVHLHAR